MADRNRYQRNNPYNQDWDYNAQRYDRSQQRRNYGSNYDNATHNRDHNYDPYRGSAYGSYGQGSNYRGDFDDANYNRGYGSYENQYGQNSQYGDYGNYRQSSNPYNRESGHQQSYGAYGSQYGNDYGRDYDRRYYEDMRRNRNDDWEGRYGQSGGNRRYNDYSSNYREDRDWLDKTADEVSSWFGDKDAERRRAMDKKMSGEHRGKGPKGYNRSDERIQEDVSDRLSDDPYIDASDIDVQVNNCEVILSGNVDSKDAKRRAEHIVESISGVREVENRLHVNANRLSVGSSTSNVYNNTSNPQRGMID